MQHGRLVISGGQVLTGSPLTGGFQAVDLSVAGGRIAEIGPDLPADEAEVIDARGTFVLPGFVWPEVRRVRSEHFASNRRDELVTLGLGVNDLFTYPWEVTRGEYALARELDLLLTSHINSVWQPGAAPEIEWLHQDGLLGPDQVCVHATTSSDHELQLLADAGASVASTPETELQMGLGFPVFARAAAYGVKAGIGADIQANNSPDPFVRIRKRARLAGALSFDWRGDNRACCNCQ